MSKQIALKGWDWKPFKIKVWAYPGNLDTMSKDGRKWALKEIAAGNVGWQWECENCSETSDGVYPTWKEAQAEAMAHAYDRDERGLMGGCEVQCLRAHIELLRRDVARKDARLASRRKQVKELMAVAHEYKEKYRVESRERCAAELAALNAGAVPVRSLMAYGAWLNDETAES